MGNSTKCRADSLPEGIFEGHRSSLPLRWHRWTRLLLVSLLLTWSCDSGGPSGPDPDDAIASVTVTPSQATVDIGSSTQLNATVRNGRGETMTTSVSWSSAASAVATVNSSGLVTGVTEGNSTITASAGGRSGTATVTVNDPSPPQQPSNVVATPVSDTEMDVTWTDNSNNEDEFRIEREEVVSGAPSSQGASLNTFSQVGTVGANVTTFRDTGLEAGHSYRFRVLACKANGCSATSPESETGTTWPALVLVTTELTAGVVGTAYSATLEATGGDATYTWSITSGSLPAGLRIPTEEAHPFQSKRPTHSNRRGPPIPTEEAHPFRGKRPTRSEG